MSASDNRPPLNGTTLLGSYRRVDASTVVVLVDRGTSFERYVTAHADSIDAPTWYLGRYFSDRLEARADWLTRAGLAQFA